MKRIVKDRPYGGRKRRGVVDDRYCVDAVHTLLPGVVSQAYLHTFDNLDNMRVRVTEMTDNLRATFSTLLRETPWMDTETRNRAIAKIDAIIVRAVHPTHWTVEPFASRITSDRWLRNLVMIRRYRSERNYALWKSRDPLDRDTIQRFGRPLDTINAFYSPVTNTVTIFAGILTPPFYDANFAAVAMYARVGTIIGHELSHALDNHGRMFDELGNFANWWSPNATGAFEKQSECIVREYTAPKECPQGAYGQQTLGENIADLIGNTLAYRAIHPEGIDREHFFGSYAQMWCSNYDVKHTCDRVGDDVHALNNLRVDHSLRQLMGFRETYNCQYPTRCVLFGQ